MKAKLNISYLCLILSILFQSLASVFSKYAADSLEEGQGIFLLITNGFYVISIICLFVQALFWQYTLKKLELSVAYPVTAINNVIILALGYFIFHEDITLNNILGVLIIMVGIVTLNYKSASK